MFREECEQRIEYSGVPGMILTQPWLIYYYLTKG